MHTKDFLAQELRKVGLEEMAQRAETGYYHDFLSPLALPEMQLDRDLYDIFLTAKITNNQKLQDEITELRKRHHSGDFDASPAESEEWAKSPEGQDAFHQLIDDHRRRK